MRSLALAFFDHLKASPRAWETTWESLRDALLGPPQVVAEKRAAPLWSAWERDPRAKSADGAFCLRAHVLVFDFDKGPAAAVGEAIEKLRATGWECAIHATHSARDALKARPPIAKFRAVVPLAEPIPPDPWREAWETLSRAWPETDQTAGDLGRKMYVPSTPELGPHHWSLHLPGRWPTAAEIGGGRRPATADDLRHAAKAWRRDKRLDPALALALEHVAAGEPFAAPGTRNDTAWRLVSRLLRDAPWIEPASVAAIFAPALSLMGANVPNVADMARRAASARPLAATPHNQDAHLLVSPAGSAVWLRAPGEGAGWDGPYAGDAVDVQINHRLTGVVPLRETTASGISKPLGRLEVLTRYGAVITNHVTMLGQRVSRFDPDTATFLEGACPPLLVDPEYSPVVDEYLRLLARGDDRTHADLVQWLAILPDLTRPLVALILIGSHGAGKSLLAECCASVWGEPPVPEAEATSNWTGSLLRCPVVFADEYITSDTKKIRQLVQARAITITRKFLPNVEARGSLRILVAANSDQVLRFGDDFDAEDLAATRTRLYPMTIDPTAREFSSRRGAEAKRAFAAHVAYLAKYVEKGSERFGIRPPESSILDRLSVRGGARGDLCWWITAMLEAPSPPRGRSFHVTEDGEHVALNVREVITTWEERVRAPRPTLRQIRQAVGVLGASSQHTRQGNLWVVHRQRVQDWANDMGWNADIRALMARLRESDARFTAVATN